MRFISICTRLTKKTEHIILFLQLRAITFLPKSIKRTLIHKNHSSKNTLNIPWCLLYHHSTITICNIEIKEIVARCACAKKQCNWNQSRGGSSLKIKYFLIYWLKLTIIIFNKKWWRCQCLTSNRKSEVSIWLGQIDNDLTSKFHLREKR